MQQRKQKDGTEIARASRTQAGTQATLGSVVGAAIAVVLVQECSTSPTATVMSTTTILPVLSCRRHRLGEVKRSKGYFHLA